MTGRSVRLATRASPLARHQTELVAERLRRLPDVADVTVVALETTADRTLDVPISSISGVGAFTREIDTAVLDGRADLAVHSAKDLPSAGLAPGLCFAAVVERADPRDALVGCTLDELAPGATVATGAPRRRAQLAAARPDLVFASLRGNIGTRLSKLPPGGAVVVAYVALRRLGLDAATSEVLPVEVMLPQVGQAAIALTCRGDDPFARSVADAINDPVAQRAVVAERSFLARLGGGCDAPVGAYAVAGPTGELVIDAVLARPDGSLIRRRALGGDAESTGRALAEAMLRIDGADAFVVERS